MKSTENRPIVTEPDLFNPTMSDLFWDAIEDYVQLIRQKLEGDEHVTSPNGALIYSTRNNLITSTYSQAVFSNEEQERFYHYYDCLWKTGNFLEAYCLLRLVFGVMSKKLIEKLQREGHLLTYRSIVTCYRKDR